MKKRFSARNSSRLNKSTWACYSYLMPLKQLGIWANYHHWMLHTLLYPTVKRERRKSGRNGETRLGGLLRQLSSISTMLRSLWDMRVRETSTQTHCWPLYSMCMLGHTVRLRALHGQLHGQGWQDMSCIDGWSTVMTKCAQWHQKTISARKGYNNKKYEPKVL